MLFKLSLSNIRKSMKDYAVYFFTLILGVALFYIFNAIDSQTAMLSISSDTREIVKLLCNVLSAVSVFVAFVLGFLVIYASRFLMKRRNKEFALYLLLGMGKRKVSLILFFETLLIGLISLAVGLLCGVGLSQLTSLFVANMFDADMEQYRFVFSGEACSKTILYFAIIYVVVILFNTFIINKCRLIDLLQGSRKSERIKLKNPIVCMIVFAVSAVLLGVAYYRVAYCFYDIDTSYEFLMYIALGCVGTFLFFWSLSGLLFWVSHSVKSVYYKGLNSFVYRQMSSRINTNVLSMTIICLMLFVTICVLSVGINVRNSMNRNLKELAPADLNIQKAMPGTIVTDANGYSAEEINEAGHSIWDIYLQNGYGLESDLKEYADVKMYETEELTFYDTISGYIDEIEANIAFLQIYYPETIMKISDYNKVAEIYGKDTYQLDENQYIVIADYENIIKIRNIGLSRNETINVYGKELSPKYKECKNGFVTMAGNHINTGIIVVPDDIVDESTCTQELLVANYKADTKEAIEEIETKIDSIAEDKFKILSVNTKIDIKEASVGLGAIFAFIGLYIGLVFLISGAAILALKELSESADNVERYRVLKKLGADESQINSSILKQTSLFFVFPLFLAIVHSVFGIKFSNLLFDFIGTGSVISSILTTGAILLLIYGGYFVITYISCKNMIKE